MTSPLLPTRFLFRFSAPCRYKDPLWTKDGAQLDETYRLVGLAELEAEKGISPISTQHPEGRPGKLAPSPFPPLWADVRAAWSEAGLVVSADVQGKRQPPWCRASRPEDSDGLQVWIDTRDVHNVHRASRFCHWFVVLAGIKGISPITPHGPPGAAHELDLSPLSLPINRAREQPQPVRKGLLKTRCKHRSDGYNLEVLIPAEALTGFDPAEHPRLGFTYAVIDRELGQQTFGVGSPMPYQEDPSLWATLELLR
jgi:hypothetical protein